MACRLVQARRGWNQVELLCAAGRLRLAVNGVQLLDYSTAPPQGPAAGDGGPAVASGGAGVRHRIALQQPLAAAGEVGEMHFRGLLLAEQPEDRLLTVR